MPNRTCTTPGCTNPVGTKVHRCGRCNYRWQQARPKFTSTCRMCGATYKSHRKHRGPAPLCGTSCRTSYTNWTRTGKTPSASQELVHVPTVKQAPTIAHIRSKQVMHCGRCSQCNQPFVSVLRCKTCSTACSEDLKAKRTTAKRQRRRARERNAPGLERFLATEIFRRDHYRCHICRRQTLRSTNRLHPRHPTLDHLIPLSKGGAHTRANVATACRLCNSTKSDRGAGDQLALL